MNDDEREGRCSMSSWHVYKSCADPFDGVEREAVGEISVEMEDGHQAKEVTNTTMISLVEYITTEIER